MPGTDFLGEARRSTLSPSASCSSRGATAARRKAILTGCAVGQIEFFITKPWHTAPDERFHREVAGFLYEWSRLQRPVYEAVRLVGERWAPRSHELRDLLGRNGVAYGFYDADSDEGREILRDAGLDEAPRCRSPSSSAAASSRTRATARSRSRSGCAAGRPPTSATC